MKIEHWNGHKIRFVEKDREWWAVSIDIARAMGYKHLGSMLKKVKTSVKGVHLIHTLGGEQELSVLSEKGIYFVIMRSRKKEAEQFQDWVFDIIKTLRQSTGLEGFEVFRMLDKEHQKEAMSKLNQSLKKPVQKDFIKANTIANKAVSNMYGYSKMVKKDKMTPDMLKDREPILTDTVDLMVMKNKFNLSLSVKDTIYNSIDKKIIS